MKSLFMTMGLMIFCLTANAQFASPEAAPQAMTNTKAVTEAATLFFGNTTGKIERLEFRGHLTTGEPCTVTVRKTRWGIYFGILSYPALEGASTDGTATDLATGKQSKYMETGVTYSGFTTQNLEFTNDPANGVLQMSRIGVTHMDERGQDTSSDKLELNYETEAGAARVTKITVQVAPLDVTYDIKSGVPTYSPSGKMFEKTCVVQ